MATAARNITLTPDEEKFIVAVFKQITLEGFHPDYDKIIDDLELPKDTKKGTVSKRWQRLKAKLLQPKTEGASENPGDEVGKKAGGKKRKIKGEFGGDDDATVQQSPKKKAAGRSPSKKVTARKSQIKSEDTEEESEGGQTDGDV